LCEKFKISNEGVGLVAASAGTTSVYVSEEVPVAGAEAGVVKQVYNNNKSCSNMWCSS